MARGLQKIQAQQKAGDKKAGGKSNLKDRAAAFKVSCPFCKMPLPDLKNAKEHWNAKHDKMPMPTDQAFGAPAA
ncbi:hypothetical protein JCM8115_002901 [Rhodotorula mucilaginosa]|uniref:Small EDRK-rich factor-like N-terminal domain-containing protein n=1 Tax=Rhodotorula mucilaginosa TaxID=5537 RepID=A0A9P7B526_RHOMI|nr:hypothetical protein C6P46_005352 [Rhodotorula mucilaginosa]KWU41786.1 hypothetical protein RHOSPDRAFT_36674 [Rhodotorula sp. JG-1b]